MIPLGKLANALQQPPTNGLNPENLTLQSSARRTSNNVG